MSGLQNGSSYCPLTPEVVGQLSHLDGNVIRLEQAIRDNSTIVRDGFTNLGTEIRALRTELVSAATNRDFVHKEIVKLLMIGLLILDFIIVIWFTGIAPMLRGDGVSFKKLEARFDYIPRRPSLYVTTGIRGDTYETNFR